MRRSLILALTTIAIAASANAAENVVTKVSARADGGKTIITVRGSATPSFTAYRLERPARIVVDLADGKLGAEDLRGGPIDVDTWAVGQIAMAQYADEASRVARVMIGFKRPSSYDVKAQGHDLVITITPDEPMPADAVRADAAKVDEARKKRLEAEAQMAATEERRQRAERAEGEAHDRAAQAEREATEAKSRAQAAKDELDRVVAARRAEEQRLAEVQKKSASTGAKHDQEKQKMLAEQQQLAAQLQSLRAEAQKLASERDVEARRLDEAQKAARQAAEDRQAKLEQLEQTARQKQQSAEAMRLVEERRAQQRVDEAARLAQAAANAAAERQAEANRTASREAENRARAAHERAEMAEQAARTEQQKLTQTRAEAEKQANAAKQAMAEVARARDELTRLYTAQQSERDRVEAARRDAARLAAERAQELERAQHAAAMASGSLEKMALAEKEARKIADERARESSRLDVIKKDLQAAAAERADEVKRLEAARAEAQKLMATRDAELKRLEAARKLEEQKLAEVRGQEQQAAAELSATRDQLQQTMSARDRAQQELRASTAERDRAAAEAQAASVEAERAAQAKSAAERSRDEAADEWSRAKSKRDEMSQKLDADKRAFDAEQKRLAAERAQAEQKIAQARRDAARAQAELDALDGERRAAAAKAAEASRAATQAQKLAADETNAERARVAAEKKRIEGERVALQAQLDEERTQIADKLKKAQDEMARLAADREKKVAEQKQLVDDRKRLESERAQLELQLQKARAELQKIEKATREKLAFVPTPARNANVTAAVMKPMPPAKDALPVEKVGQARVRDVRFSDGDDAERVMIDVAGATETKVVRQDEKGVVLKLTRAELPKKLERTLDASAFAGPIKSVSAYRDADDPGAVRVEVALADGQKIEPTLTRGDGSLTWEFPRVRSLAPAKVAPFGTTLPMQVAGAVAPSGMSRRPARRTYTGKRITLDLKDADIHNVLKLLADVAQVNVIAAEDVKGTVTITMRDVPWDQALDVILKAKGLGAQREGNLIRVAPQAVLEKEMEADLARAKAAVELKPVETRLIGLSYADGAQMLPRVQELLSSRGRASIDARTNHLIITDVAGNIALAEDLVRNLDTQTPQVSIEARIVEADTTFTRDIGIQWGGNTINSTSTGNPTGISFPSTVGVAGGAVDNATNVQGLQLGGATTPNYVVNMPAAVGSGSGGALGLTLGSLNGAVNINLRLSALENTGNVKIISAPKVTTLDNVEAAIEQGTSIPISVVSAAGTNTVFVDAKLNLTVKPHITNEGSVLMNIAVSNNAADFSNVSANGTPTIQKKQAHTQMLVRDGDTAVIGGIFTRNTGLSFSKVPWFADIPVIGWLFKNRHENDDRTELLIFITPRIVARSISAR
jgi:type IV pilus assembly protein PilQ